MGNPNYTAHVEGNDSTRTLVEWSEFHYHFLSWLIDKDTPRDLAMGIELQLFPGSHMPNVALLEVYLQEFIDTEEPTEWAEKARKLYNANRVGRQEEIKEVQEPLRALANRFLEGALTETEVVQGLVLFFHPGGA